MTTAPRTFAKLAAKCVSACYRDSEKELVFRDTLSTTAVSSLTTIVTAAQLAEDIVEQSSLMGKLQVCIFVKSTTPDMITTQQVLWSSIEDLRGSLHRSATDVLEEHATEDPSSNTLVNASPHAAPGGTIDVLPNNSFEETLGDQRDATRDSQPRRHVARNENVNHSQAQNSLSFPGQISVVDQQRNTTEGQIRRDVSARPLHSIPRVLSDAGTVFVIPRCIAEEVASTILEGCGYFRHNSNTNLSWPLSYNELYCKHVTFLLQRVYEAEKQLLLQPNMRYEGLLPNHLSSRPVKIDGLEGCLRRGRRCTTREDTFVVDLTNRSNTQKHVAFAAVCIAYGKKYGAAVSQHAAKAVLETFRREGSTEIGCNRYRERGTNIKVYQCSRGMNGSCLQGGSTEELVMKLNHVPMMEDLQESSRPIAFGTIDITVNRVNERIVSNGFAAIHVTHLSPQAVNKTLVNGVLTEAGDEPTETISEEHSPKLSLNSMIAWKKKNIERVRVLYNFKTPIGSALLVSYIGLGSDSPDVRREEANDLPVVASYQAFDPSKAAVICDIQLYSNRPDLAILRYPYADWYKMRTFRSLVGTHFDSNSFSSGAPKVISARNISRIKGLLWHRDWLSSINGEMFTSYAKATQKFGSLATVAVSDQ